MLLIRGFEDRVQSLFLRGEIYGTTHLYSGQEAIAVGFASVLGERDRIACTYRGHGHLLAMGTDPTELLAELLGRASGVNGGLAGSMNVVDPDHGVLGCYGIVGGSIAAATGAAISIGPAGGVAVAYFGDGAANQAYFFECLNFAKVLNLPVVFVCENNRYGEYTPTEDVTPGGIVARPAAMEITTSIVDGMDLWAVRAVAAEVVERARSGGGPEFVEAATYRFVGHSRSDPGKYRPEGELDRWRERDPLLVAAARLRDDYGLDDDEVARDRATTSSERSTRSSRRRWPPRSPSRETDASSPSHERGVAPPPARELAGNARRQSSPRAARARTEPPCSGAPARCVAEPRLADRDGQEPAVGANAVRHGEQAGRLARRRLSTGGRRSRSVRRIGQRRSGRKRSRPTCERAKRDRSRDRGSLGTPDDARRARRRVPIQSSTRREASPRLPPRSSATGDGSSGTCARASWVSRSASSSTSSARATRSASIRPCRIACTTTATKS